MKLIRRTASALSLLALGLALTGCVVIPVPVGGGYRHYSHSRDSSRDYNGDRDGGYRHEAPRR